MFLRSSWVSCPCQADRASITSAVDQGGFGESRFDRTGLGRRKAGSRSVPVTRRTSTHGVPDAGGPVGCVLVIRGDASPQLQDMRDEEIGTGFPEKSENWCDPGQPAGLRRFLSRGVAPGHEAGSNTNKTNLTLNCTTDSVRALERSPVRRGSSQFAQRPDRDRTEILQTRPGSGRGTVPLTGERVRGKHGVEPERLGLADGQAPDGSALGGHVAGRLVGQVGPQPREGTVGVALASSGPAQVMADQSEQEAVKGRSVRPRGGRPGRRRPMPSRRGE